jgi:hypothetical protein
MGFFKSLHTLNKQGNEMRQNWDVGAQLADAQSSMAGAQAMMAQQTAAANLATSGVDATATINGVRQGGGMVNYQPIIELDLLVMAPGLPPIPVTVSQVVEQIFLSKAVVGGRVAAKFDPANPQSVWINWAAPAPL